MAQAQAQEPGLLQLQAIVLCLVIRLVRQIGKVVICSYSSNAVVILKDYVAIGAIQLLIGWNGVEMGESWSLWLEERGGVIYIPWMDVLCNN